MNYESQRARQVIAATWRVKDACDSTVIARFEWVHLVASALLHHYTIQPIGQDLETPPARAARFNSSRLSSTLINLPLPIRAPAMNHDHHVFPNLQFLDIEDFQQDRATRPGRRNPAAEPWRWRQVHEMLAINLGAMPANVPLSLPSSRIVYNCSISSARPWKLILQRGKAQMYR